MKHGRVSQRVFKRLEVRYLAEGEHCSITSNLSETGIFIRIKKKFKPGSVLQLKLALPGMKEIPLAGEVKRNADAESRLMGTIKSGIGIHLIDPPKEYTEYVKGLTH